MKSKNGKSTVSSKVNNIEQTVAKNNVRHNIGVQVEQMIHHTKPKSTIRVASLAAREWMFEYGLQNQLNHSHILTDLPEIYFTSAERDKSIAVDSFMNMPDNATVLLGKFSDIFRKPFKTSSTGYSFVTNDKDDNYQSPTPYQLIWADYCSYGTTELLEDFVNMIENNVDKGLVYMTFCISRKRGHDVISMKKDLNQYRKGTDICNVTIGAIDHFAKKIKGKKVHKVFEVVYGGGYRSGTSMLTVGFSVNLPKKAIKTMTFNDKEWKPQDKAVRYRAVYNKLNKFGGWGESKKIGRPLGSGNVATKATRAKPSLTKDEIKLRNVKDKIRTMAREGFSTEDIYPHVCKELNELGKTKQSVSSVIAWLSPNLAKKKIS